MRYINLRLTLTLTRPGYPYSVRPLDITWRPLQWACLVSISSAPLVTLLMTSERVYWLLECWVFLKANNVKLWASLGAVWLQNWLHFHLTLNDIVFREFHDFASTNVFKTHTNKFMTLNANELSSITMLTLTKFNANIWILFVFDRIVKTRIRYSPSQNCIFLHITDKIFPATGTSS